MYDCIIVGAGPAGATAAYHLSKAGHQVLLLDAAELPRYKPCGGGVSPQVAQWFDFDFSPAISVKVRKVRYTFNLADPIEAELPAEKALWMVRRDEFDYFIVQQAQKQGATLKDSTKVQGIENQGDHWQVNTSQGPVQGRFLIAADGARGSMTKWLGFPQRRYKLAAALEAEPRLEVPNEPVVHFDLGLIQQGYLWNFPKADGYSIGGGVFRSGPQRKQDLRTPVADYAAAFDVDASTVQHFGHPIFIWDGPQTLHTHRAVLAGEAACVVDPFTAEGIRPSIFSGMKAAQAIAQALQGSGTALEAYTHTMNQEWGEEMRWARRLARLVYQAPALAYKAGVKRPSSTLTMVKIFCGEVSYGEVAHRAIRRLSAGLLS
ncbi:geranylgeranyl reductase family protein [Nodosilinea sp. LEGE 06152]|uniref:geranylgeranyl reductase family protein n=1 Tax=Nodosilinea sp. LEGE 06152 TaxID=2777966 RepID=UPI001880B7CF|nr:geranylgeranyl reductase family protein [Nodosilinea sp. LEGE 06152]MBE9155339.1 geranylgeranyl reductase family protein [Nodosilinea sp. LEGE 06152]